VNMQEIYFAHSIQGKTPQDWQTLEEHLRKTAQSAARLANKFNCSEWGYLAGLWHDLGKYSREFQEYLHTSHQGEPVSKGHIDHSTAGAIYAVQNLKDPGIFLSYIIAGHHAGLPDYEGDEIGRSALYFRLKNTEELAKLDITKIPSDILNPPLPQQRPKPGSDPAFWIRILYSCLVDADFLDTESFIDSSKFLARGTYPSIQDLLPLFDEFIQKKIKSSQPTKVNLIRRKVLDRCLEMANQPPGIFSLTVPTGGGKTLSSMAFALHHAVKYGKERIIYVIPYTSIIEQTADQFRSIFGENVIEHHSNLDITDESKYNLRNQLASENWDAPVIVTTSVQFFESLFSSRSSKTRKLHNIINSVVILDEAQLLPPEFLLPILHILEELRKNYGVTLLLSTATQPALNSYKSTDFDFKGFPSVTEIVENPDELFIDLKRVEIHFPENLDQNLSWDEIASQLISYPTVLCIINRRDDCRTLWKLMPEGTYHLSALMCGAHRSSIISEIKNRLRKNISTRVISTQLVEAGVDLDFPVVYRALAGLDSIVQASGRCNREGMLEKGETFVFVPPSSIPAGHLRKSASITKELLSKKSGDYFAPAKFHEFFRRFYWLLGKEGLDKYNILSLLTMRDFRCSFRSAAEKFHLIDDSLQRSVIVSYGEGRKIIQQLEKEGPDRFLLRKAQRYIVNLPHRIHYQLLEDGAIKEVHPGIYVQIEDSLYDENIGFMVEKSGILHPDDLVI